MRVNVSLWGLGQHAIKNIIPSLIECESTNLVGAWSRSAESRDFVSKNFSISCYQSSEELLNDSVTSAVVLCTPTGLHYRHGESILEAGKDLWCEKSLAVSPEEVINLESIASKNTCSIHEMFMFLYHPQFQTIKEIIDSGRLGELRSITSRFGFPHLGADNFRYNPDLGGGALLDAGCYPIAATHDILGSEPKEVWARIESEGSFQVDTSGHAIFRYDEGPLAFLQWGFGFSYRNEIEIWGSEGLLKAKRVFSKPSSLETEITMMFQSGSSEVLKIPPTNHFSEMFSILADNVASKWNTRQARLIEQVRESSASSSGSN